MFEWVPSGAVAWREKQAMGMESGRIHASRRSNTTQGCDMGVHTHLLGISKRGTLEIDAINQKEFATHNSSWPWGE